MWNLKNTTIEIISSYNNSGDSKIGSQGAFDYTEKDEISVRTKVQNLLGDLCVYYGIHTAMVKSSSIFLILIFYSIKNNLFLYINIIQHVSVFHVISH